MNTSPALAVVFVFVPTYRRAHLLKRALASLRAQTCRDWCALVRNDAPDDDTPETVVRELADPRIRYECAPVNLGGSATLDLAFAPRDTPFAALLEDDNWWEADFLARMLAAMEPHPDVDVAWSNQRIWDEQPDGSWIDTGRTVRPLEEVGAPPRLISWGQTIQLGGALHANGTLFWRTRLAHTFRLGTDLPMAATEPARERLFPHPLLYVPDPLGHFAVTRQTARAGDFQPWIAAQILLLASFARHCDWSPSEWCARWAEARRARPPLTSPLLLASLQVSGGSRWRFSRPIDWLRLARGAVVHPVGTFAGFRARHRHPDWWRLLDHSAAQCFARTRHD